jgi:hypothetical protein
VLVVALGCAAPEAHAARLAAASVATTPNLALWAMTNLRLRWRIESAVRTWWNVRARLSDTTPS